MKIEAVKTRVFQENESLIAFISKYIKNLKENSILVVTSKIVALSEGRVVENKNETQKNKLIRRESAFAMKTKIVWLTIRSGMVMANAGIDDSNANGKLILLPKDSFKSAQKIRSYLRKKHKIKNLGIIIADSGLLPLRNGVIGMARGYVGFKGIKNYTNKKDIFGRKFKYTKTNIADSLATAATVCMGEGNEKQPLALITNAPVVFTKKIERKEMLIKKSNDIFYPLLKNLNGKRR